MKNSVRKLSKVTALGLASVLSLGIFAACGQEPETNEKKPSAPAPAPVVDAPTISVTPNKTSFKKGESITLDIDVSDGGNYDVTVDSTCVSVNGNTLTMTGDIELDKWVTVSVIHSKYPSVVGRVGITAKAPVIEGQVGQLTTAMLQAAGNASVTVSGTLTDIYENKSGGSSETSYNMTVKMEEGKWMGSWYAEGHERNVNEAIYAKGTETAIGENKDSGHVMLEKYINKDNQVTEKAITNYMSFPTIWESQHLWNHIGGFNITKFEYDAQNEVYAYKIDHTPMAGETFSSDEYLMTYLSYSMTPLLSDTLDEFYLKVENGKVTKILGSTEKLYDNGNGAADDYTTLSYTLIDLTLSDVGETTVPDPKPYEEPTGDPIQTAAYDALKTTVTNMQGVKNYSYFATDTTTYKPVADPSEYEMESVSGGATASTYAVTASTYASSATGGSSSTGTVGQRGFITENAIVLATTGKYDYALDDNLYYTSYSGYKKIDNDHYDYFTYNSDRGKLMGERRYSGTIADRIPSFNFSALVFEFKGMTLSESGKYTYTFVCRDSGITRELAQEVSMYKYASSAEASATQRFTIVVDSEGKLVSTTYPYSMVGGSYLGYVNTIYSDINSTTIPQSVFGEEDADYIPRVIPSTWGELEMKQYYVLDHYDDNGNKIWKLYGSAQKYMEEHYTADERALLPTIGSFFDIFDDAISGVFQQDKKVTDSQGTETTSYYWSLTANTERVDEHSHILQEAYEDIIYKAKVELAKQGYQYDPANSSDTIKRGDAGVRFACFTNGTFKVVIENNFTKNFWIYCYKAGEWELKR